MAHIAFAREEGGVEGKAGAEQHHDDAQQHAQPRVVMLAGERLLDLRDRGNLAVERPFRRLLVAPLTMRKKFLDLMRREIRSYKQLLKSW